MAVKLILLDLWTNTLQEFPGYDKHCFIVQQALTPPNFESEILSIPYYMYLDT